MAGCLFCRGRPADHGGPHGGEGAPDGAETNSPEGTATDFAFVHFDLLKVLATSGGFSQSPGAVGLILSRRLNGGESQARSGIVAECRFCTQISR